MLFTCAHFIQCISFAMLRAKIAFITLPRLCSHLYCCVAFLFQLLDSAMFTFEERFNEGITGTDAKTNGQTAADVMKVVKEEVLLVRTHMGTARMTKTTRPGMRVPIDTVACMCG